VIKQRMQVHESQFRSVLGCARTVYRTEGLHAFYVSYPTTLTMTVPFTAVQFTVYEQIKALLNPKGAYSPMTHIVSGGIAGAVAAAVTTPLDVAKTLLQTRGTSTDPEIRRASGMRDAFRIILQRDGLKGLTRGLTPRVLTFMPSNALSWLSYEFFSEYLVVYVSDSANGSCRGGNTKRLAVAMVGDTTIDVHRCSCALMSICYLLSIISYYLYSAEELVIG
jgi:solute carrier family 25 (mitochondrial iron transporter), member 28/37